MTNGMPEEPMTTLIEGLAHAHEIFKAAIEVGFTENQAMTIVIAVLTRSNE